MSGKEQFQKLSETMKFVIKDDEWYRLIYFDSENNICRYRKAKKHGSATEGNTMNYGEACELYSIEIIENPPMPDQYFLIKVNEATNSNMIRTVSDRSFISYVKEHKENCMEAVEKLKDIVQSHENMKVRKAAYKTCVEIGVDGCEELITYTTKPMSKSKGKRPSAHKSKVYNPPVGEFGFCCEEEKMAIVFSHIRNKYMGDYKMFQKQFKNRYSYESSILSQSKMKKLFYKYYQYAMNGKFAKIQEERKNRINSDLPDDILNILTEYGLKVTRADGRGTSKQVKKCKRKKQYDQDRLSGYRIISADKGIPIAGKRYELYEEDVKDFVDKLISGEILLDKILKKESE